VTPTLTPGENTSTPSVPPPSPSPTPNTTLTPEENPIPSETIPSPSITTPSPSPSIPVLTTPFPTHTQKLVSIKGNITDANTGEPLSGASVAFGNVSDITDSNGTYELRVMIGEHDNLTINRPGYKTVTRSVRVLDGGINLDSTLSPIPLMPVPWSWILILFLIPILGVLMYVLYKKKKSSDTKIPGNLMDFANKSALPPEGAPCLINMLEIQTTYEYKSARILYKVTMENNSPETITEIKVSLLFPNVFMLKEKEQSIPMLEPKESKTVIFDIRPAGECGDFNISGKIEYYDSSTKKHEICDMGTKLVPVICPVLKKKLIDLKQWEKIRDELIKAEETIQELSVPAENLFNITTNVITDNDMFMLKPEVTYTPKLFEGFARFYGEGMTGLRYAVYVEVGGGTHTARLILKVWAEKEEELSGLYHLILREIEKRIDVKIGIDEGAK
jgi:hypothetical protein